MAVTAIQPLIPNILQEHLFRNKQRGIKFPHRNIEDDTETILNSNSEYEINYHYKSSPKRIE